MHLPLIISDSDGRILYKSRAVKTDGFLQLWSKVAARNMRDGLVLSSGKAYYVKSTALCGKNYIFFMDYEKLGSRFGTDAASIAEELFNIKSIEAEKRKISLNELVSLFASNFSDSFYHDGIRMKLHPLASDATVNVSPRGFILSLALMTKLSANDGRLVSFSFACECDRIVVFCDSDGKEKIKSETRELLEVLLYATASAAEFAVQKTVINGSVKYALELSPLDISLLGLKVAKDRKTKNFCAAYVEMFL